MWGLTVAKDGHSAGLVRKVALNREVCKLLKIQILFSWSSPGGPKKEEHTDGAWSGEKKLKESFN